MPHVRATWADDNICRPISASRRPSPRHRSFRPFNANSGFKDVQGGVNLIYRFNRHWFAGADVGVTQLMGEAAASPISIRDTNLTAMAMAGYRF